MSQNEAVLPKSYDFKKVEAKWIAAWEESGLYRYNPESPAAKSGRTFSVDTPPPYVSAAHLHVGHAMSYSQAEFVIRYKRMRGYEVFYPMGFDDNGLPTERYVEKKYKVHKGNTTRKEFIDLCLAETQAGAKVYQQLWQALGLSVDWRMTYSTIAPRAVLHAQKSFLDLSRKGRIERRADPILWDVRMQTALAQADVEPGPEINRPMHKLRFDRADGGEAGLIDTTRPELVTACVALACHPTDERFADLTDVRFKVPLTDLRANGETADHRTVPLIHDESVDPEFGTGLMMVCTFGDQEDIIKWRTHRLDLVMVIGPDGRMDTPELPELHGKRVHVLAKKSKYPEARLAARDLLEEHGYLLGITDNVSRAAIAERSGTPIEIQVVPQWFIRLLDMKEALIARGQELNWHPTFMRDRYEHWVDGLKWDWNISRQRFYGVPLPVWYRDDTGAPVLPTDSDLPIDPLVDEPPASVLAQVPEGVTLTAEQDVMDTWMTSSITPLINSNWASWEDAERSDDPALAPRPGIYPMGVRVQAFEIIRTWLFYSVAKSHMHTNSLPWKDVMISGWGLDKKGKKMSKRLGNFVDPAGVIEKYSADSLRYWAAGATLGQDLRYLENDVKGGKRLLTKLWNSTRFALMSIGEYDPTAPAPEAPTAADRWIRARMIETAQKATAALEGYEYNKAIRATEQLFWRDWCDNYLEIVKDRFRNPDQWQPEQVEAARATIFFGTWTLLRLFAPVLPFITEELYQAALRPSMGDNAPKSVHSAAWPVDEATGVVDVFGGVADPEGARLGGLLVELVGAVRQLKTEARIGLGRPLETIFIAGAGRDDVTAVEADWRAAARAAEVTWLAPSVDEGAPTHPVGDRDLRIGIVPVPTA
ncbi:MAG: valine--tRNA ligase [Myxococcales bacterium]|nr:valine--tRNA ligase [Myxococcales bacterium]